MNSVTKFFTLGFPSSTLLKFGQPSSKSQRSVSSPSHEPTPRHFGGSSVMHSCGVVGPGSSLVVQTDPDSSTAMHTSNFFGHGVGCGVGYGVGCGVVGAGVSTTGVVAGGRVEMPNSSLRP